MRENDENRSNSLTLSRSHALGRANAAKFVETLCKYPGNPHYIEQAQKHILAEIGDLYPLIPDPEAKKNGGYVQTMFPDSEREEVPPGYVVPVAYLWTRTVRCKNPSCGTTVPLVKQTWVCKKKGGGLDPAGACHFACIHVHLRSLLIAPGQAFTVFGE